MGSMKRRQVPRAEGGRQLTVARPAIFPPHRDVIRERFVRHARAAMADDAASAPHEVYFEITRLGAHAKVVAIDGASGIEAMVLGPAHAAETELKRLAVAKLRARLARPPGGA
jgi:hypothetical protein